MVNTFFLYFVNFYFNFRGPKTVHIHLYYFFNLLIPFLYFVISKINFRGPIL